MSVIGKLASPLDTIVIEVKRGDYKSFGLSPDSTYPLAGVTYPVDYGYLPQYFGEDGDELDFFVGSQADGSCGYFTVWRLDVAVEHKYYVALTDTELTEVLKAYEQVTNEHHTFASIVELIDSLKDFTDSATM